MVRVTSNQRSRAFALAPRLLWACLCLHCLSFRGASIGKGRLSGEWGRRVEWDCLPPFVRGEP